MKIPIGARLSAAFTLVACAAFVACAGPESEQATDPAPQPGPKTPAEPPVPQSLDGTHLPPSADTKAPTIVDVVIDQDTGHSATITWTTDERAQGLLEYGQTQASSSSIQFRDFERTHTATVENLVLFEKYYFQITATDAAGNSGRKAGSFGFDGASLELGVFPDDGLFISGLEGGSFEPLEKTYELRNLGSVPHPWEVHFNDTWLFTEGPSSGLIAPGEKASVTVAAQQWTLETMLPGSYESTVEFLNPETNATLDTREVRLNVIAATVQDDWTQFVPSHDTRIIYVSNSEGKDSNNGLSESKPKKSIQAGMALLREGRPDWLLLKRGDTWATSVQWNRSGRSLTERALLSSYGDPSADRPKIMTGGKMGIRVAFGPKWATPCNFFAFVDIEVSAEPRPAGSNPIGIEIRNPNRGILIEGCYIHGFKNNINLDETDHGISEGAILRRNVIAGAKPYKDGTYPHSQGLYVNGSNGTLLEENIFVQNGWNKSDPLSGKATVFNHNAYITDFTTNVTVRGNMFLEGAGSGLQQRPGGVCDDNLFAHSGDNAALGSGNRPDSNPNGVTVQCRNNVFLHGRDVDGEDKDRALVLNNIQSGIVSGNIFGEARKPAKNGGAIMFNVATDSKSGNKYGIQGCTIEDNKFTGDHGAAILVRHSFSAAEAPFEGVVIRNNIVQDHNAKNPGKPLIHHITPYTVTGIEEYADNVMFSSVKSVNKWCDGGSGAISHKSYSSLVDGHQAKNQQVNWIDPDRDLASYMGSLGFPSKYSAFRTEVVKQRKGFWRPEFTTEAVNDYIRAGFEVAP